MDPRYAKGFIANCSCSLVYYVNGEVNAPGPKFFNETATLSAALNAAGGFTKFADTNSVWLIRSPEQRKRISLTGTDTNINAELPVYSGNIIEVKRRNIFSR